MSLFTDELSLSVRFSELAGQLYQNIRRWSEQCRGTEGDWTTERTEHLPGAAGRHFQVTWLLQRQCQHECGWANPCTEDPADRNFSILQGRHMAARLEWLHSTLSAQQGRVNVTGEIYKSCRILLRGPMSLSFTWSFLYPTGACPVRGKGPSVSGPPLSDFNIFQANGGVSTKRRAMSIGYVVDMDKISKKIWPSVIRQLDRELQVSKFRNFLT